MRRCNHNNWCHGKSNCSGTKPTPIKPKKAMKIKCEKVKKKTKLTYAKAK